MSENSLEEFAKYVHKKTIAFVAPSPYLDKHETGKLIESCDIVVSMNNAIYQTMNPDSVGKRVDILYHGFSKRNRGIKKRDFWEKHNGEWVITAKRFVRPYQEGYLDSYFEIRKEICKSELIKFRDIREDTYKTIDGMCKGMPTTGTYALFDLLQFDCKIYVFGLFHPPLGNSIAKGYTKMQRYVIRKPTKKHRFKDEAEVLLTLASVYKHKLFLDPKGGKLYPNHSRYKVSRFTWESLDIKSLF